MADCTKGNQCSEWSEQLKKCIFNLFQITKIIELPQKIDQSATDNSLSADDQFLGFESVSLSNDQNRNLEAFHRVLGEC